MLALTSVTALSSVIMQPTTLCNLDCGYCYLPERARQQLMFPTVARSVAASIAPWTARRQVELCWHGGEPLAVGVPYFRRLVSHFADLDVVHNVQTNATLVDGWWCEFLAEYRFRVGVSIDGPQVDTSQRVDRGGKEAFGRIVRGIRRLVECGFAVSVIAVVSNPSAERARRLYEFVAELGCVWLGVNIEETEGVNRGHIAVSIEQATAFWAELAHA